MPLPPDMITPEWMFTKAWEDYRVDGHDSYTAKAGPEDDSKDKAPRQRAEDQLPVDTGKDPRSSKAAP